ncbi:MAG: protein kinase [bacterium]|nr:protein kinase [bacterium]
MNSRDHQIEQLVARALTLIERGQSVDLEKLCADDPGLAPIVDAALARQSDLKSIHRAAAAFDPLLGKTVNGRYMIAERIGAGAMGVVYRALDKELSRPVAIKLLRADFVADRRIEDRFAREAEALARIRHGAVVTVHDRGRSEDGRAFLVLELLAGQTGAALLAAAETGNARMDVWRHEFRDAALADNDVRQCVRWIARAAEGLIAAHAAGVIHRDIKPSNLFIERDGNAVLLDFGIVSLTQAEETLTATGSSVGTPAYMAPEQLDSREHAGPAADVYGLGATLYHLLTGEPPFRGTAQQVLTAIARTEPAPADRCRPGLPDDLVAVLEKAMVKNPNQRYGQATELREDLLAWLDLQPVSARRISMAGRVWRRVRRSPAIQGIAITLLAVAVILIGQHLIAVRASARSEANVAAMASIPPTALMSPIQYRETSSVTRSARVHALFDKLVATADAPGPAYAMRAVHRLDRGELRLAAEDFAAIAAESERAPTAAWLASECRAGRVPDLGADPSIAPDPVGAADRYTAALFALRSDRPNGRFAWQTLREVAGVEQRLGYAELLLIAEMIGYDPEQHGSLPEHYHALERRCKRLNAIRGRPIATILHVESVALLVQTKLREARETVDTAIELAPEDSALQIHRGSIALMASEYGKGTAVLRRAIELQPRSVKAHELLAQCLLYSGDPDGAEQLIEAIPFHHGSRPESRRAILEGRVAYYRAVAPRLANPAAPIDEAFARLALASYRRAAERDRRRELEIYACQLLIEQDPQLLTQLLQAASRRPLDPPWLSSLAILIEDDLDGEQTRAIKHLLRTQATKLRSRDQ